MADGHISNDEFFQKLTQLLDKTQQNGHGSVFLTQKRLVDKEDKSKDSLQRTDSTQSFADLNPSAALPIIVRATDGKSQSKDRKKNKSKIKLSTVVQPDDIDSFFSRYAETCRASMQSLRKRDRSKRKGRKKKDAKKTEGVDTVS